MADAPPSEVQMRYFAALFAGLTLSACDGAPGDSGAEPGECRPDAFVESWILADLQAQRASVALVDASGGPAFGLALAGALNAAGEIECEALRCEAGAGFDTCAQAACDAEGWSTEAWLVAGAGPVTLPLADGQLRVEAAVSSWTRDDAGLRLERHVEASWMGERRQRVMSSRVEGFADAERAEILLDHPAIDPLHAWSAELTLKGAEATGAVLRDGEVVAQVLGRGGELALEWHCGLSSAAPVDSGECWEGDGVPCGEQG